VTSIALRVSSYHAETAQRPVRNLRQHLETHSILQTQHALDAARVSEKRLQVCKFPLRAQQAQSHSEAAVGIPFNEVEEAARMTQAMVKRESRGAGDTENARRRIASRYKLPYGTLWSLQYRKPKGVYWNVFERIRAAYQAECIRQAQLLSEEIELTERLAPAYADSTRLQQAQALVHQVISQDQA